MSDNTSMVKKGEAGDPTGFVGIYSTYADEIIPRTFKCVNCGETDTLKWHPADGPVIPMIACWSCKAGQHMNLADQIQQSRGMKLVPLPEEIKTAKGGK